MKSSRPPSDPDGALVRFRAAISAADLPDDVRAAGVNVTFIREQAYEIDYFDHLSRQAEENSALAERSRARHDGLSPYAGRPLWVGRAPVDGELATFVVDPESARLLHWERFRNVPGAEP